MSCSNCVTIPLTLDHFDLLESHWKPLRERYDLPFAEYSFANNYLFRKKHNYMLLEGAFPLVIGKRNHDSQYIIPSQGPEGIIPTLDKLREHPSTSLFPIPDIWKAMIPQGHYQYSEDDSDYVFHAEKMRTLAGRKLSSRRNLLHQLENNHAVSAESLTQERLADARFILEDWQQDNKLKKDQTDYESAIEALGLMDKLQLSGRIVYVDGVPAGFTIGEILTPTTAILLFAKRKHDVKGIVPYLYRDFALQLPKTVEWINLEQDLGNPLLRQAKMAYAPDLILKKWHLYML